ncbi:DNA oxidative demethylase ALKBH2, partial [Caerostris extrusa]
MNSLSNRKMDMDLSKGSKKFKSTISYSASSEINCSRSLEEKTSSIVSLTSYCTLNTEKVKAESQNKDYSNNINLITVDFKWKNITDVNLKLRYAKIFSNITSKYIFDRLENETKYYSGDLLKVMVYGKWHNIPRKQVAFGDDCLSYKFSGISLPSKPWQSCPIIYELKKCVEQVTAESFNFVLVNRYKDGVDHMGEHEMMK